MFNITPRLRSIINFITDANVVADIGCDHAYVAITLVSEGRAKKVIACDIKEGPLKIASDNIKKYNKEQSVTARLGSGLDPIEENEADTIIIAGMGGELIEEILKENIKKARCNHLILQPMNSQETLRHWLIENDFVIEKEDIAIEGFKVYNILSVKCGHMEHFKEEIEYHIPPYLKNHKNYKKLYQKKERELKKVITGLRKSKEIDTQKLSKYERLLEEMEKL